MVTKLNVDVNAGDAVNNVVGFGARAWGVIQIALLISILFVVPVGIILIWKWIKNQNLTVQAKLVRDKKKSAKLNKTYNVEDIYIYTEKGFKRIGAYGGQVSGDGGDLLYVRTVFDKSFPILKWLPDVIYDLLFSRDELIAINQTNKKVMFFKSKDHLILHGDGLRWDGKLEMYIIEGTVGLPKRVLKAILNETEDAYLNDFVNKISDVIDSALEINPYVKAKMKSKEEREDGEDFDA